MLLRLLCAGLICLASVAAARDTRHIILITADGLRWQDLFGGMDPMLKDQKSAGMEGAAALKACGAPLQRSAATL